MRPILVLAAAATTMVGVTPPVPARADSYVTCASQNYQRNWCPVYSSGRAYLDRQYSDGRGPCIEGSTWGQDRRGIWVDRGCRARFRVQDRYGQYPNYGYPDYNQKKDDTGALIGGLLIGLIETFWAAYFSSDYKDVAAFSVLAITLIFMPQGLLGKPEVEKV